MDIIILIGVLALILLILFIYYFTVLRKPKKLKEMKALVNAGKYDPAISGLQKIVKENNFDFEAHKLLGDAYLKTGKKKLAIVEYRFAEKDMSSQSLDYETEVRKNLADLLEETEDYKGALEEYLLVIKANPKDAASMYKAGTLFIKLKNIEKALQYLKAAVAVNPNESDYQFELGKIFYKLNSFSEAIEHLEACIKLNGRHFEAYLFAGYCHKDLQDYGKAQEYFTIAERSKENKAEALLQNGICLTNLGNYSKVISELGRAIKLTGQINPETLNKIRYFLANAYEKQNKITDAIEQWEKIMKNNPKFRDVAAKMEQYESVRESDYLKDYMTSSAEIFSDMCQRIVSEGMQFSINDSQLQGNELVDIGVRETTAMLSKPVLRLFRFSRQNTPVSYSFLRSSLDILKANNYQICIVVSVSGFDVKAKEFATSRPFQLIKGETLNSWLTMLDNGQQIELKTES